MVDPTLLPQQLNSALAGMDLPTRWHHAATGDNDDNASGFHWVGLLILLLKLLPFALAIAGIIYRKTRRGAAPTSSAYAPNGPIIAPWPPLPAQASGEYTPHSPPVAPWQPVPPATSASRQPSIGAAWQPAPNYPTAPGPAAPALVSYAPALYR